MPGPARERTGTRNRLRILWLRTRLKSTITLTWSSVKRPGRRWDLIETTATITKSVKTPSGDLFFRKLDFLVKGADRGEVKYEQITYTQIEYPPDAPLEFKKLPKGAALENDPKLSDEERDHMSGLDKSKFALSLLKEDGKDILDWVIETLDDKKCKALDGPCDLQEMLCEGIQETLTDKEKLTCTGFSFDGGVIGQAAFPAFMACLTKFRTAKIAKRAKCFSAVTACRINARACELAVMFQIGILHGVHIGVKIGHAAVEYEIVDLSLAEAQTGEQFNLVQATYHNAIKFHEWNEEALDIVNYNIREQHTQMRGELQVFVVRCQCRGKLPLLPKSDCCRLVTKISQMTSTSFLGNQIFNALPGATAGSLSTLCSNLLGVGSGRRLLSSDGGPYSLKVTYDDNSFIEDIKEIQVTEEEIIEFERKILENENSILKKEDIIIEKEDIIIDDLATVKGQEDNILQNQEQILKEMQVIREALDIPPADRPPTRPPTIVTTPRPSSFRAAASCGNDSCEMAETNKSCPHDCIGAQLDTTSYDQSMASSSESIKFVIKAKRAVAIKSLSFYTSSVGNSEVTVLTQKGQYSRGIFSDLNADEWKTVFHGQVVTRGYVSRGAQLTTVKIDQDVVLLAGKTKSFEVRTASSRIMVQLGEQEGMLTRQDMALEVHVGRSGSQSPAAFRGIIKYDGLNDRSNPGGRSKSAKAKAAKLEKDYVMLDAGTTTAELMRAEINGKEEAHALDLVWTDVEAINIKVEDLDDKLGGDLQSIKADVEAMDDQMGALALEGDVQSIMADVKATKADVADVYDKMEALEEDVQSIKSMMARIVKLLETSSDVEEKSGNGPTN
ncbi:hypothetical protein THAOC_04271 [Thalassiosira oceanica]|uniref:Uncharacterized protein n=1 Tax=Thalassiosira oceanica TaxID=159749 RepID=K0TJI5_THAOC|nr:hypothetical protein THAOC_04271 [Thalassiosira oceanica]|eukprot:EJK74076.1 hypothetical protein THAOC_04271 [Thalassiosira oceanica]